MGAARDFDGSPRLRWAALLLALVGHGAVFAALMMVATERAAFAPPSVLAVKWVGEDRPATATPEPPVKPRPLPMKPRVQPVPRSELAPAPTAAEAPAVEPAPAAEPAMPVLTSVASSGSTRAEPMPVVAPRFDADYLSNPAPAYPSASRAMGEQGKVFLRVLVSQHGEADQVRLHNSSGFERLDLAALEAVRRWKFVPARQGSEAVAAWVIVPIAFTLRR
jgi:protein TonB